MPHRFIDRRSFLRQTATASAALATTALAGAAFARPARAWVEQPMTAPVKALFSQRCSADALHAQVFRDAEARLTTPEQKRRFRILAAELRPVATCPFCGCPITAADAGAPGLPPAAG